MLEMKCFGRLTQNPTVQYTSGGTAYCNLSIAVNDDYRDKKSEKWIERVYFFDLKLWGKAAERAVEKYHKGMMVYIEAKPTQERWEDKEGQKRSRIVFDVRHIEDIERFGRKSSAKHQGDPNAYQKPPADNVPDDFNEDDIPF